MADRNLDEIVEQLKTQVGDLERAQKALKKPSTISFAERTSLSARAGKSLAELQEHLTALDAGEDALKERQAELDAAIERAEKTLSQIDAAQPAGLNRNAGAGDRRMPGGSRRGASGPSQQRAPNRSGGE